MKRYFVKTNAYNCVVFADGSGKGYVFRETEYNEPLTLKVAQKADYSNVEGCETLEEIAANAYGEKGIINFDPDDFYSNPECEMVEF